MCFPTLPFDAAADDVELIIKCSVAAVFASEYCMTEGTDCPAVLPLAGGMHAWYFVGVCARHGR